MEFPKYCLVIFLVVATFSCTQKKKYHNLAEQDIAIAYTTAEADILEFQRELNNQFKNPETSPLPDKYRKNFEGLDFFGPDTTYIVTAKFSRTPDAIPFLMPTTTDRKSKEVVYGIAEFSLNGKDHKLEIYKNQDSLGEEGYEDDLFLPFTDLTNGEETYAGGRYIDLRIPNTNELTIDFNRAYNPYCVYNKKYSCPLVPSVNSLDIKIMAGVKDFKKSKK